MFRQFVIGEVSSENLEFYLDVEEYKKCKNKQKLLQKSQVIFGTYFDKEAQKEVSLYYYFLSFFGVYFIM